jgi:hypothetical protein
VQSDSASGLVFMVVASKVSRTEEIAMGLHQ